MAHHPPIDLKPYLWSTNFSKLDIDHDRDYIIHQTLSYGSLKAIFRLFSLYPVSVIRDTFISHPKPLYTPSAMNFLTKYFLQINPPVNIVKYLKNARGPDIRP